MVFSRRLIIPLFFLGLFPFGSILGRLSWIGDLLATPLDYVFVVLVITVFWAAWRRAWPAVGITLVLVIAAGYQLINVPPLAPVKPVAKTELRVFVQNIYYQNDDLDHLIAELRRHDPDLIFLMEYSYAIQAQIEDELAAYPFRTIEPSRYTMGLALLVKFRSKKAGLTDPHPEASPL